MAKQKIQIIDDTLREGMQYRGLMFSCEQRLKILEYQVKLGIDICRAGYPPAHEHETEIVKNLAEHSEKKQFSIRVAAMGRACRKDIDQLISTGVSSFHLHLKIQPDISEDESNHILQELWQLTGLIRKEKPGAHICVIMMDLGKTDEKIISRAFDFFATHPVDIISLADTSGVMTPDLIFDKISRFPKTGTVSVHCHNDLGMASANTFMGIKAGARCFEASVLGIGERNGIADLYSTAASLKNNGFAINVKTEDLSTFTSYYEYVDNILYEQHSERLLKFNTPFFGDGVKAHVAGTHAMDQYAETQEELLFLNSLCGKKLVRRFLAAHGLGCPDKLLEELTHKIKTESFRLNRSLTSDEVQKLLESI